MTVRKCKNCIYFAEKKEGYTLGRCEFPLPLILSHISTFIDKESGEECMTFRAEPSRNKDF